MDTYERINPEIINDISRIDEYIFDMPDYTKQISREYNETILGWLFNSYLGIMHRLLETNNVIPTNISKPLSLLSNYLGVFPWISPYYLSRYCPGYSILFNPAKAEKEKEYLEYIKKMYAIYQQTLDALHTLPLDQASDAVLQHLVAMNRIHPVESVIQTPTRRVFMMNVDTLFLKHTTSPIDLVMFYESLVGIPQVKSRKDIKVNMPQNMLTAMTFFKGILKNTKEYPEICSNLSKIKSKLIYS
jgi:hypothetical protein